MTFAIAIGFLFAVLAQWLQLPFILGAYLAGMFVREKNMGKATFEIVEDRIATITHGFLGPLFIMSITFKVSFGVIVDHPYLFIMITVAAFAGKLIGVSLGSILSGFSWKKALIMGSGMNGRGGVELVFANVGVSLGILHTDHLSLLVFMAFITTLAAPFLIQLLCCQQSSS
ncbi:MAG: cation:proton antiporter [Chlamydiota bacterium]